jgi:hypothetical protein
VKCGIMVCDQGPHHFDVSTIPVYVAPLDESEQVSPGIAFIPTWATSLGLLDNITTYTLSSMFRATVSVNFLQIVVRVLIECTNLRDIRLNFNVYSYHVPVIRLLRNITSVTLGRPSRTVLTQIGPWVEDFIKPLGSLSISVHLPGLPVR